MDISEPRVLTMLKWLFREIANAVLIGKCSRVKLFPGPEEVALTGAKRRNWLGTIRQ